MTISKLPRPTLVIVEDEPLILFIAMEVLEEAGFEVIPARDVDEALRILQAREDISAIFTDIDMPGSMNGVQLATLARDRWPAIEIIVTSGHIRVEHGVLPQGAVFVQSPMT